MDQLTVGGGDTRRFLAAVLESVEAEECEPGYVFTRCVHTEDAALFGQARVQWAIPRVGPVRQAVYHACPFGHPLDGRDTRFETALAPSRRQPLAAEVCRPLQGCHTDTGKESQ